MLLLMQYNNPNCIAFPSSSLFFLFLSICYCCSCCCHCWTFCSSVTLLVCCLFFVHTHTSHWILYVYAYYSFTPLVTQQSRHQTKQTEFLHEKTMVQCLPQHEHDRTKQSRKIGFMAMLWLCIVKWRHAHDNVQCIVYFYRTSHAMTISKVVQTRTLNEI